jgi:aminoglycoside phosphotransferase (APT) family kinase protein
VAGGYDTAIWRFATPDGKQHALRLFRAEQAIVAPRERAAMEAAAAGGVPVPPAEALGQWHGRPAMVLAWAPGVPLLNAISRQPWTLWRLGLRFGRMHARIHRVTAPPMLRGSTPNAWMTWGGAHDPALIERLRAAAVPAETLLHLDYHPLNTLTDGRRITAVLDWTNAFAGDRRADLARTITILRMPPLPPGLEGAALRTAARLVELAWRRGYTRAAGWPSGLAPFLAWAGSKMANDFEPRIGRGLPGVSPAYVNRLRRWTERWME